MAAPVDAATCHGELELDTPRFVGFLDPTQQLERLGSAATIAEWVWLSGAQCEVAHYLRRGIVVELTDGSGELPSGQGAVITQVMHGWVP